EPLVQFQPTLAERIFKTLLRPCSETIERDRKACNAHSRHIASTDCNSRSGQPPLATKEFQALASKGGERTAWSMNRRKQKARNEREVIHEEAEFHLVAAPARRTVERRKPGTGHRQQREALPPRRTRRSTGQLQARSRKGRRSRQAAAPEETRPRRCSRRSARFRET